MVAKQLLGELRKKFSAKQNPDIAKGQQSYMKSEMPFWGLQTPARRKIYPPIFKKYAPQTNSDYRKIIIYIFENAKYREEWYAGFSYAQQFMKYIIEENVDLYLDLVRITQWWDLVDGIATNLIGPALQNCENMHTYLNNWIVDENMWVRRTAILTQLNYKTETDFDLLSTLITKTWHEKEFFIRKAIGWALRQYSYISSESVIDFINNNQNNLSTLSKSEGLKALKRKGII
ncbi:MAG: DNA alkylation repair protein [Candidatus Marinimicrobia bacterium]|nr:DNA alkylation repair protein [Candidatus Neomarinimicrobiota bacterium]MBL7023082.1 DNA alkylation repair protein [Candidatus Neomarinimicrobiota bacterium]MBL7109102.1 DNA alkylation repair protein [Candidatus Neomarinimicrobiota bacterium]